MVQYYRTKERFEPSPECEAVVNAKYQQAQTDHYLTIQLVRLCIPVILLGVSVRASSCVLKSHILSAEIH